MISNNPLPILKVLSTYTEFEFRSKLGNSQKKADEVKLKMKPYNLTFKPLLNAKAL